MTDEKNKRERLSELFKIPPIARVDHRHMLDRQGNPRFFSKMNRNQRRQVKKEAKKVGAKYQTKLRKISKSGAGYPVDQLLKFLAVEYTHRYMDSGVNNQPTHFNYFEPFCQIGLLEETVAPYAEPLKQIDNLFSIVDFFEYITSDDAKSFDLSSLLELSENQIFHYTTNGDIAELTFLNASGREVVISGFSIVRRRRSLHWYLLGGEIHSESEWETLIDENYKIGLDAVDPMKRAFLKEAMEKLGDDRGKPISIEGMPTAIKTIVSGEIDLVSKKYHSRIFIQEFENMFHSQCDDPDIFGSLTKEEAISRSIVMAEELDKYSVMWDLVGSLFALPAYFSARVNLPSKVREAAGKSVKPLREKGGKGINSSIVRIPSLNVSRDQSSSILMIKPKYYETEKNGYWRRLKKGSIGKGPDGKPEPNRTWIKTDASWHYEHSAKNIYIKSTIKAAKLKAAEYFQAAEKSTEPENNNQTGFLYVMRCIAMDAEVYKVGYTERTAEVRAQELSSSTSVPEAFIVVNSWHHPDAKALETNVHAMLDPYRINQGREFFKAPYRVIKKIIESEIDRTSR